LFQLQVADECLVRWVNKKKVSLMVGGNQLLKIHSAIVKWESKTPSNSVFGTVNVGRDKVSGVVLWVKDEVIVNFVLPKNKSTD
jgi:hypothetical protein